MADLSQLIENLSDAVEKLEAILKVDDLEASSEKLVQNLKAIEALQTSINELFKAGDHVLASLSTREREIVEKAKKQQLAIETLMLRNAEHRIAKLRGVKVEEQQATRETIEQLMLLQKVGTQESKILATKHLQHYYTLTAVKGTKNLLDNVDKFASSMRSAEGVSSFLKDASIALAARGVGTIIGGMMTGGAATVGASLAFGTGFVMLATAVAAVAANFATLKQRIQGISTQLAASEKSTSEMVRFADMYVGVLGKAAADFMMNKDEVQAVHSAFVQNLKSEGDYFFDSMRTGADSMGGIRRYATSFGITYDEAVESSIVLINAQRKLYGRFQAAERATADSVKNFAYLNKVSKETGIALPALNKAAIGAVAATAGYVTSAESISRVLAMILTQRGPVTPATAAQAQQDVEHMISSIRGMGLATKMLAVPGAGLGAAIKFMRMTPDEMVKATQRLLGGSLMFRAEDTDAQKYLKMLVAKTLTGIQDERLLYQLLSKNIESVAKLTMQDIRQAERDMAERDRAQRDAQGWLAEQWKSLLGKLDKIIEELSALTRVFK